ncbi:hypothetical protein ACRAKI_22465 [Saccharothrix isguenensis]
MAVLILSARHGLLDLDTRVEPYDQRMSERDAAREAVVADQSSPSAEAGGIDIHAFLVRPCLAIPGRP